VIVSQRVIYRGQVQGVGFRYTAQSVAGSYPVAGYVRNLETGDVELVAEGEADQVQAFLDALAGLMANNIDSVTVSNESPAGHRGFRIRRD
jgi:acylphosphatase